jgi:hypothetical protein
MILTFATTIGLSLVRDISQRLATTSIPHNFEYLLLLKNPEPEISHRNSSCWKTQHQQIPIIHIYQIGRPAVKDNLR